MYQPLYPYIVDGPDCECGHRRLKHVERVPGTSKTVADGPCQSCDCERFRVAGETHDEWLLRVMSEMVATEKVFNEQMAELRSYGRRTMVVQMVAVVGLVAAAVGPESWRFPLIGMSLMLLASRSLAAARRAHRSGDGALVYVHAGLAGVLFVQVAATLFGVPLEPVLLLLGVAMAAAWVVGWRDSRRSEREYRLVEGFIKARGGPPT